MNRYRVRVTIPIYYDVMVEAKTPEEAESEAIRRFHEEKREPLDYGSPKALRAKLVWSKIGRASPTHSYRLHGRYHR